jgi:poly(3-hydroxybutyrate) depolymerase
MHSRLAVAVVLLAAGCAIVVAGASKDTKSMRANEDRTRSAMLRYRFNRMSADVPRNGSGEYEYSMQRPEGARQWFAYVPTGYGNGDKALPLVFAFHGLGDHAQSFAHNAGMVETAEKNTFILVYPQGFEGLLGTGWNAGMLHTARCLPLSVSCSSASD